MAKNGYIGIGGVAKKIGKYYIGDENGVARKVAKAYIGDENGVARLCFQAHEHSFYNTNTYQAYNTSYHRRKKLCACGEVEWGGLLSHSFTETVLQEQTCTHVRRVYKECKLCGHSHTTVGTTTDPNKHGNWGEWIIKTEPKCILEGKKIRKCGYCGYIETASIPAVTGNHSWVNTGSVRRCEICGISEVVVM